MFSKSRVAFALVLLFALCSFATFAQEESDDWYMDKPITKITFNGLNNIKKSEVSGLVSSYIGRNVGDCFFDLLNRLEALDYFEEIEPGATHDSGDGVILVINVVEKPVISSIRFHGNKKVRNPPLREALTIKVGDIFVESEVLIEERALRDVYLDKGFTDIRISHTTQETDAGIVITFNISEGNETSVVAINFEGNSAFSSKKLKGKTKMKVAGFVQKGSFKESQLELDRQAITQFYMEHGYLDFNIIDVTRDIARNDKKDRDEMTITYYVYEGPVYTFEGLSFTGNKVFSTERLKSLITMKVGEVFNATKFSESLMRVSDLYYENGYTENSFQPAENRNQSERKVSYVLNITERDRSHVENIIVKGNTKTKDFVITRELPIESGDVFSKAKITNGLRNLYNLQFFSSVVPTIEPGSNSNLVDIVISVEEQQTNSIEFGVTFSGVTDPDDLPFSLFAQWSNTNFLGLGKRVSAGVTLSADEQSINLGYTQNWLWGLPVTWNESISFSHARAKTYRLGFDHSGRPVYGDYYMEYERWRLSAEHSLAYRWMPDWAVLSISGGLTDAITDFVYDEDLFTPLDPTITRYANNWGLTNSVWTKWSMDARDINYDPSKGWFFSERVAWYGILPIEVDYFLELDTKLEGYVTLFNFPITEKWAFKMVLAGISSLSLQFPTPNSQVSDINKLYLDGMFNARGWTEIYNSDKGSAMWSNNLELRVPVVPGMLAIDGFFDIAVIKNTPRELFGAGIEDFYFSFGPDVRILMPQFPLRLLFANCFRIKDGKVDWGDTMKFVLSFNLVNR